MVSMVLVLMVLRGVLVVFCMVLFVTMLLVMVKAMFVIMMWMDITEDVGGVVVGGGS